MIRKLRRFATRSFSIILSLLVLMLAIMPTVSTLPLANAQALQSRTHNDQANAAAVQLASPAVVRIVSVIDAQLTCVGCLVNSDGSHSDIVSPAAGQNPFEFGSAGSGAFITSDGFILTADHVVDHTVNNAEDVAFIEQAAAQDIATQYPNNSASSVLTFLQNNPSQVSINMQVVLQKAFLSTAYTGTLQSTGDVISYDVTRTVVNSPINQDDTAIIKVEASDMPYLPIAPANSINVGDQVTAIAYPADADDALRGQNFLALANPSQSDANTLSSLLGLSVNTGQVTSKKTLSNGTPVYEAGSIASQGSSGGPVIDDQGRIIGFVDAGPSSGTDRVTFLVPSEVIAQYVKQSGNSNPTPGNFQTLWTRANQEQFASGSCHWTKAASDYQKIQQQYPKFAGIASILATAKSHATPSECPPPAPVGLFVGAGAGLLLIILIVAILAFVLLSRRRKPAVAGAPASGYGYGTPQLQSPVQPAVPYTPPSMGGMSTPGYQTPDPTIPGTYSAQTPTPGMPATPTPAAYPAQPSTPLANTPYTPSYQPPTPTPPAYQPPASSPYQPPTSSPYQPPVSSPYQPPTPMAPTPMAPTPMAPTPVPPPTVPPMQPGYQPPASAPVAPMAPIGTRFCVNGHAIADPTAQFCPVCGGPVRQQ